MRHRNKSITPWLTAGSILLLANVAVSEPTPLGWTPDACRTCGGFFAEQPFLFARPALDSTHSQLWADHLTSTTAQQWVLRDHVSLFHQSDWMQADAATVWTSAHRHPERIQWTHGRWFHAPNWWISSQTADLSLLNHQGSLRDVQYRLQRSSATAHGHAASALQTSEHQYQLHHATYSTCTPSSNTWQLHAQQLDLNTEQGWGRAWHSTLHWHQVPVLYWPVLDFPLDERRKSGLLWPTVSSSSDSGWSVSAPYYVNWAPNYDMTLTPTWMSRRGIGLEPSARYLFRQSTGALRFAALPHDRAFQRFKETALERYPDAVGRWDVHRASSLRTAFHAEHHYHTPHTEWHLDYNHASDDQWLHDFEGALLHHQGMLLPQQLDGQYRSTHGTHQLLWHRDQVLHPLQQSPLSPPYRRWPEYLGQGFWSWGGSALSVDARYAHLIRGRYADDPFVVPSQAHRWHVQPTFSHRWDWPHLYALTEATYFASHYQLRDPHQTFSRTLPGLRAESGLFLENDTANHRHTLQPKIQFKWLPYRSQNHIPLLDPTQATYGYEQLFQWNRFNSIDRIGDARELLLGISGETYNKRNTAHRFHWALAQQIQGGTERNQSCSTPGCYAPDLPPQPHRLRQGRRLAEAAWTPNDAYLVSLETAWDPNTHRWDQTQLWTQYTLSTQQVLNVGYLHTHQGEWEPSTRTFTPLKQLHVSGTWRLTPHWSAFGALRQDFHHRRTQDVFYGLSEEGCCYTLHIGAGRWFKGYESAQRPLFRKTLYLHLVLNGLGGIGTHHLMPLMQEMIPGYRSTQN